LRPAGKCLPGFFTPFFNDLLQNNAKKTSNF